MKSAEELLSAIRDFTLERMASELEIRIREYPDRLVLNYGKTGSGIAKFHPLVIACRNLVVSKNLSRVLHRSFDRFFNYGEDEGCRHFAIKDAVVEEKLDGSLVGFYHDGKDWCVCTRSTAFAEGEITPPCKYSRYADAIAGEIDLAPLVARMRRGKSYIFEFCSKYNKNITDYPEARLVLLAVRDKESGEYEDRDREARYLGWTDVPREWRFGSLREIRDAAAALPEKEEGYVCRWGDVRYKVKNPAFVALMARKAAALTPREAVRLVHRGEDAEYLLAFPDDEGLLRQARSVRDAISELVGGIYAKYEKIPERKDFAIAVRDEPMRGLLFRMRDGARLGDAVEELNDKAAERLYRWTAETLGMDIEEDFKRSASPL